MQAAFTSPLSSWLVDWYEQRLSSRQWLHALLLLAATAAAYCETCTLLFGNTWRPSLSLAWAALLAATFGLAGLALRRSRRVVGRVLVVTCAGMLFAAGENALGAMYWQRSWDGFAGDVVTRVPLLLLLLATLDGPAWLRTVRARAGARATGDAVLTVPTRQGEVSVNTADVMRIHAAGNYVELHTRSGRLLLRATLASLETRLAACGFVRVHRSALVNCRHVLRNGRDRHGEPWLDVRDGTRLRIGRRYRAALDAIAGGR